MNLPPVKNYSPAVQFLYGLQQFGAHFGLERAEKLAALAGNPQTKLRFIHVAGTNGKGSTCAMLESIYRAAGLRVGLFTSPHLVSFRERIQINRDLISQNELVRLVEEIRPLLKNFPAENHPTMFEVVTILALKFFAGQKCDLVIWETGLGGKLDATNIVTPLASVITNIAFDHQQWLGDTLEKIALEKAGIIKNGIPVLTAVENAEALAAIEKIAREKNSPLTKIPNSDFRISNFKLPLLGDHQKQNAALALATVEVLQNQIPVSETQIQTGFQNVNWPGRLQWIEKSDGRKFLLDGAHNVAGAEMLKSFLEKFSQKNFALILGILQDKNWDRICQMLAPLAETIFIVPVASQRTANPNALADECRKINSAAKISVCDSLAAALQKSSAEKWVVVTGSLYLIGEALAMLDPRFANSNDERVLNEWSAQK